MKLRDLLDTFTGNFIVKHAYKPEIEFYIHPVTQDDKLCRWSHTLFDENDFLAYKIYDVVKVEIQTSDCLKVTIKP